MKDQPYKDERRQSDRIAKNFILSYYVKSDPTVKHDMSQIKNISVGGACFLTSQQYEPQTELIIELKTPFLAETTHLEGTVVNCSAKLVNVLYETHLKFGELTPQAKVVLEKIIEHFKQGNK